MTDTVNRYTRADVLRILRITARQLTGWERAGLIPVAEAYSFSDLVQLSKLRDLRAKRVRAAVIRASVEAMQQQASGMANPLLEAGVVTSGSRLVFRHSGATLDPIHGQFVLDFEEHTAVHTSIRELRSVETAAEWFAKGVALEENPAQQMEAINCYKKAVELDPRHAAGYINLGTLHYNRHDYAAAEMNYRKAIEVEPRYALAYFDLGNVLDETGRLQEAVRAYTSAITISPVYADSHYNLALAFEKLKQPRKALIHWRAYVKLDALTPWAEHARKQIRKILEIEKLRIVWRRP